MSRIGIVLSMLGSGLGSFIEKSADSGEPQIKSRTPTVKQR
jgi:hypothetical protein